MNFQDRLQKYHAQYVNLWWETTTEFPQFTSQYTRRRQMAHEREMDNFINKYKSDLKSDMDGVSLEEKIKTVFQELQNSQMKSIFQNLNLTKQFTEPLLKMFREFITTAYEFDPNLKPAEIRQALRNLWTAGSLQLLFKQAPRSSPAIFAYSMLYPYTDNYLDNVSIPLSVKNELNQKFQKRLAGETITSSNSYERTLFNLVTLIETQFPRTEYPDLYQSIMAIHQAQVTSLRLQLQGDASPYERDILGISFKKGGCSVLADGYLVNGDLTEAEAAFSFGYGVFLQLVDDLRDVGTDSKNNQMTVFSQIATKWPLDRLTNRIVNFSQNILKSIDQFEAEVKNAQPQTSTPVLKELIQNSVTFLILEAISRNKNLYSRDYLRQIKEYIPFRPSYLSNLKTKLNKLESGISGRTFLRFAMISQYNNLAQK